MTDSVWYKCKHNIWYSLTCTLFILWILVLISNVLYLIAAKISLTESFYKTSESEGVVVICVILKNPVNRNVSFELDYREITAGEIFWHVINGILLSPILALCVCVNLCPVCVCVHA